MNNITFKSYVSLYNFMYRTVFDEASFHRELKRNDLYDNSSGSFDGCVYGNAEKDYYLIYVNADSNIFNNTLAHEVYHLVDSIKERCGLEYSEGTGNEHIAYLTGYITDQVLFDYNVYKKNRGDFD